MRVLNLELKSGWYYPLKSKSVDDKLLCRSGVKRFFGVSSQRITFKVQTKAFDGSTAVEIGWHPRFAELQWRIIGGVKYWKPMNHNAMDWLRKHYAINSTNTPRVLHVRIVEKP